mgnify:FL=1
MISATWYHDHLLVQLFNRQNPAKIQTGNIERKSNHTPACKSHSLLIVLRTASVTEDREIKAAVTYF